MYVIWRLVYHRLALIKQLSTILGVRYLQSADSLQSCQARQQSIRAKEDELNVKRDKSMTEIMQEAQEGKSHVIKLTENNLFAHQQY